MSAPRRLSIKPLMLIAIYSPDAKLLGRTFEMPASDTITIGRSTKNNIVLDEDSASRVHARFELRNSEWWVVDLDSTNGVFVNDEPTRCALLNDGDKIRVGATIFKLDSAEREIFDDRHIFQVAAFDGLTNLLNRREWQPKFSDEMQRAVNDFTPLSLLLFDLDHFKKINDTYGHLAGDFILREVAALLRAHQRPGDITARYGGEEFVWLMPHTDLQTASELAESLRQAIERHACSFNEQAISIKASFGVAQMTESTPDPTAFFRLVDEKLYEAKRDGRNRVVS